MNPVELRQLVSFDAVVRYGGFGRAADHLGIAQPAVSAHVRRLEDELGVRLLARTTRRVGLTEAGRLLLARVRRVLTELETARDEVADLAAVVGGQVVLGAAPVLGGLDLAAALAGFAARHPGVLLTVRSSSVADLLADLDDGEVDLVVGPVPDDLPRDHTATPLLEDALVLLTPPGHRLARSPWVDLAELRDEAFVCLPPDSGLRHALDAAAADAGFRPDVPVEAPTPADVRAFVGAGLGVALLAAATVRVRDPGPAVGVHRIRPPRHHPPVGLVHRGERHLSPAARALHAHLVAAAHGDDDGSA